jgi:uncharacterized membrane protein YjjP (DUF1212 family)
MQPDILSVSLDLGAAMMRSGADVHRVEDTVTRINRAYSDEPIEVFTISSLIVATEGHGAASRTESRRIAGYATDLGRLEALNDLSRRICRDKPSAEQIASEAAALDAPLPRREQLLTCLGYLLSTFGFCIFFGGTYADAVVSALIGVLLWLADRKLKPFLPNHLAYTLLTATLMGFLGACAGVLFPALHPDKIMIGDVMLQIPGLMLINSLRDMLLGDTMTGCLRTVEALLTALAIAVGFAIPLLVIPGSFSSSEVSAVMQIISSAVGTLGFSLFFHVRNRRLLPAVVGGALTISVYLLCAHGSANQLVCFMASAVFAGVYAEIAARLLRAPVTVFLVPGLVPLLPGGALYYAMAALVQGDSATGLRYAMQTTQAAIGIAVGALFSSLLVLCFQNTRRRRSI